MTTILFCFHYLAIILHGSCNNIFHTFFFLSLTPTLSLFLLALLGNSFFSPSLLEEQLGVLLSGFWICFPALRERNVTIGFRGAKDTASY